MEVVLDERTAFDAEILRDEVVNDLIHRLHHGMQHAAAYVFVKKRDVDCFIFHRLFLLRLFQARPFCGNELAEIIALFIRAYSKLFFLLGRCGFELGKKRRYDAFFAEKLQAHGFQLA